MRFWKRMTGGLAAAATLTTVLAGWPATAQAATCSGDVRTIATPAVVFYVDTRTEANLIEIPTPFLYMESNGIPGLQRGGTSILLVLRDACNGENPDQFIA